MTTTTATPVTVETLVSIGTFESSWLGQRLVAGQKILNEDLGELETFNITAEELLSMDYDTLSTEVDCLKDALKHEPAYILQVYTMATDFALSQSGTYTLEKQMTTTTTTPVSKAAADVRILDVIEDVLMGHKFDLKLIDDLVLGVQEYMKDPTSENKSALALISDSARLKSFAVVIQQVKNSEVYQDLIVEYTPEIPEIAPQPSSIVAINTTAKDLSTKPSTVSEAAAKRPTKGSAKVTPKLPMPTIASVAEIEALDRTALIASVKAVKSNNPDITIRANAATSEQIGRAHV